LNTTRQLLVYADIGCTHTYHTEGIEASAVSNKEADEEVNAEKTGDTFMLRDPNFGKFKTKIYLINCLNCDSSSYTGE
jgi:hypothetical protein